MAFTAEWQPGARLWETKNYGRYDEVDFVRTFLGRDQVYVPVKNVLVFETSEGFYRTNPFIKQAVDSLHYNGIEIIAFDTGSYGKEETYREILCDCGYSYIQKIALASAFGKSRLGFSFSREMVKRYSEAGKKYGMISDQLDLFAKKQRIDFIRYPSPASYPERYYFGRFPKREEKFFQNFLNEQLFNGTVKESRGYHFGFAFEGIFIYSFCRFLKQRSQAEKIHTLYFTAASDLLFQAYSLLYPQDSAETIYIWNQTERGEELDRYLKGKIKNDAILVDFSLDQRWKLDLSERLGGIRVLNLCDFMGKNGVRRYGKYIEKAISMLGKSDFFVERYENGLPIWSRKKISVKEIRNEQEIQRGVLEFAKQFRECQKEAAEQKNVIVLENPDFVGQILRYAFDEVRRKRSHSDPVQILMQSKIAKKSKEYLKNIYRRIKGK